MELDHAVIWVRSAEKALSFYVDILGPEPVRPGGFKAGKATFRVSV